MSQKSGTNYSKTINGRFKKGVRKTDKTGQPYFKNGFMFTPKKK